MRKPVGKSILGRIGLADTGAKAKIILNEVGIRRFHQPPDNSRNQACQREQQTKRHKPGAAADCQRDQSDDEAWQEPEQCAQPVAADRGPGNGDDPSCLRFRLQGSDEDIEQRLQSRCRLKHGEKARTYLIGNLLQPIETGIFGMASVLRRGGSHSRYSPGRRSSNVRKSILFGERNQCKRVDHAARDAAFQHDIADFFRLSESRRLIRHRHALLPFGRHTVNRSVLNLK